jgi:hypothetical protein
MIAGDLAKTSAPTKPRRRMKVGENILPILALPPILVTREEAAACLGMSPESFDEHVRPTVAQVPVSPGLVLFRPETLRKWVEEREMDPPRDCRRSAPGLRAWPRRRAAV